MRLVRKSGKIALVTPEGAGQTTIASSSSYVADFLGYGSAADVNDYEGEPRDGITVKKVMRRRAANDTDNNAADFKIDDLADNPDKVVLYSAYLTLAPTYNVYFSHSAGFYGNSFTLTLSTDIAGAEIYYTLDGSNPFNEDGSLHASAIKYSDTDKITVSDRTGQPTNIMNIPGTTDSKRKGTGDNRNWPPERKSDESEAEYEKRLSDFFAGIFKISSIKAQAKGAAGESSQVAFSSYIVSEQSIKDRFDLPVVCITTDKESLYNAETGIWMEKNLQMTGKAMEREAQLQFFEKDGTLGFEDRVGIRLNGGQTRTYPQKAIRVYLSKTLNYDLFAGNALDSEGKTLTKFDTFLLRAQGNNWQTTAITDAFWARFTYSGAGFENIGYRPCVAFLNGEFWGIYDIRERVDDNMFANHYGISKNDVVVCESFRILKQGEAGDERQLRDLVSFINANDMSLPENYNVFTYDKLSSTFLALRSEVDRATPEHRERWQLSSISSMNTRINNILEFFRQRSGVLFGYGLSDLGAVYVNDSYSGGSMYVDGVKMDSRTGSCFVSGKPRVLAFEAESGYTFLGFELSAADGSNVRTTDRNGLPVTVSGGGFCKPVVVKTGETTTANISKSVLADSVSGKLSGSLAFSIDTSHAIIKNELRQIDESTPEVKPMIVDGRTLVPARFITESLGGTVTWDAETSTGVCMVGGNEVRFVLGSNTLIVNGAEQTIDVPAQALVGGRTMLPLRAFCESLGYDVVWNSENRMIIISPGALSFSDAQISDINTYLKGIL